MTKFNELSFIDLQKMVDHINTIFCFYEIDKDSRNTFWECVDIGNKKFDLV